MNSSLFALIITLSIQVLASLAAMTAPVLAPEAAPLIHQNATKVGVFVSIIYFGAMFSSLFSGDLIARYGSIRMSQVCLVLCALGLCFSLFGHPLMLILGALCLGCGCGPITPASSDILVRNTPANKMSLYFSLKQTGVPLGGVIAGLLLPLFVLFWGWGSAVIFVVLLCLFAALLCQIVQPHLDHNRDFTRRFSWRSTIEPFLAVIKTSNIRQLAICTSFFSVMQLCLSTYLVTYLTKEHQMSLVHAGYVMFLVQASGVIGRICWGAIVDQWIKPLSMLTLLAIGMALCAFLLAGSTTDWPLWTLLLICAVFGATAIGWNGVYLAEVARLAPTGQVSLMTGGSLFFTYLGVVVGPSIFTFIVELTTSFAMGYLFLGVLITLVSLYLGVFSLKRQIVYEN